MYMMNPLRTFVPLTLGLATGCSPAWDGFWLVVFDDPEEVSGDCWSADADEPPEDSGDQGDRNYYLDSDGDHYTLVEVETRKGAASLWIPDRGMILQGTVNGDAIEASYKGSTETGWRSSDGDTYSSTRETTDHRLNMSRSGGQATGTLFEEQTTQYEYRYRVAHTTIDEDGNEVRGSAFEEESWQEQCTMEQDFSGSREAG
jgi:hypothetical protein